LTGSETVASTGLFFGPGAIPLAAMNPLRLSTIVALLALVGCTGEKPEPVEPAPPTHAAATMMMLAEVENVVGVLRDVSAGKVEVDAARTLLDERKGTLNRALALRRAVGPATTPEDLAIYAALEPRRKALFTEFNELSLRLRREKELLKQAQGMVFPAIEGLAAGAK
jgi:hypothetical protein